MKRIELKPQNRIERVKESTMKKIELKPQNEKH